LSQAVAVAVEQIITELSQAAAEQVVLDRSLLKLYLLEVIQLW
jgi:hypothetical protein